MPVRWMVLFLGVGLVIACERPPAAVHVQVERDVADASWLELRARSQDGARVTGRWQQRWASGQVVSFNLVPVNSDLEANPDAVFEVVAASCGAEGGAVPARCVLVSRRLRVRYQRGEVRRVAITLESSCRGVVCGGGESCARGRCVDERWDAPPLDSGLLDSTVPDIPTGDTVVVPTDAAEDAPAGDAADAESDASSPRDDVRDDARDDRVDVGGVQDAPGADVEACPAGRLRCGPACVDPSTDAAHCGRCDLACPAGVACSAGSCAPAREVSVLDGDACALLADNSVRCWGAPFGGVFGVSSSVGHRLRPHPVTGVSGRRDLHVATNGYHCVVASPTEVTCWGDGGATTRAVTVPSAPIAQLQCGWRFCCVRLGNGLVGCWGANDLGQLGDGTLTARTDVRAVVGMSLAADLSCGVEQCCAALTDGTVRCWGSNYEGQFGNGTFRDVQSTPVAMRGASGVAKVSTGPTVSCVLTQGGAVRCVGGDWLGQLGDGPGGVRLLSPSAVATLSSGVSDVRVGYWNACARRTDGSLWCWGTNLEHQSGAPTRDTLETPRRVAVPAGLSVTQFDPGVYTTCAVLSDGSVRCWGRNINGQLGNGQRDVLVAPAQVSGFSATHLDAGIAHTCALRAGGVSCWGDNWNGQLGIGTRSDRGVPTAIESGSFARLAVGNRATCFGAATGSWRCTGSTHLGQLGLDPRVVLLRPMDAFTSAASIAEVSLGEAHTCGRSATGEATCWGANNEGQLGLGTTDDTPHPTHTWIAGHSGVVKVASGFGFTCMMRSAGEVLCWGDNYFGQLGDGTTTDRTRPIGVALPAPAVDLFAGQDHACALLGDGTPRCWGANRDGSLGDGTFDRRVRPVALLLPSGVRIRTMALGQSHSCGVSTTGELYCWGSNFRGELGLGREALYSAPVPQRVPGLTNVADATLGWTHSCVRRNDGTVWCWGSNEFGQLGNGSPVHPAEGFAVRF